MERRRSRLCRYRPAKCFPPRQASEEGSYDPDCIDVAKVPDFARAGDRRPVTKHPFGLWVIPVVLLAISWSLHGEWPVCSLRSSGSLTLTKRVRWRLPERIERRSNLSADAGALASLKMHTLPV